MQAADIKLFRWATYVLPGSLVAFPIWMFLEMVSGVEAMQVLTFEHSAVFLVFAFLGISYVAGLGLWGVGYHPLTQKKLFGSHHGRLRDIRKILNSPWYKRRGFSETRKYFPSLNAESTPDEEDAYHDFELAIVEACGSKNQQMVSRIVQQRETIGLIQALILGLTGCAALLVILAMIVVAGNSARTGRSAVGILCGAIVAVLLILALCIHYQRRQYYLVRDVVLALLVECEQKT